MNKNKILAQKNWPIQAILVGLLIVSAFFIGQLSARVRFLEKTVSPEEAAGGGKATPTVTAKSKYSNFEEAMKAIAKQIKIDDKKLLECLNKGEKKSFVEADISQGNELGVTGTPAFYINGRFLGGAFPLELFKEIIDKELAGTTTDNVEDYSQALQNAAARGSFDPKPKAVNVGDAPAYGGKSAKVTIVEFSDFQCPFCETALATVKEVLKQYEGKVLFAYKHFPLISIHPRAQKTAEAAECARNQDKFWEFHDKLFESQSDWASL